MKRERKEEQCRRLPPLGLKRFGFYKRISIWGSISVETLQLSTDIELPDIWDSMKSGMVVWQPESGIPNVSTYLPFKGTESLIVNAANTWAGGSYTNMTISGIGRSYIIPVSTQKQTSMGPNVVDDGMVLMGRVTDGSISTWCDTVSASSASVSGTFSAYNIYPYGGESSTAELVESAWERTECKNNKKEVTTDVCSSVCKDLMPYSYAYDRTETFNSKGVLMLAQSVVFNAGSFFQYKHYFSSWTTSTPTPNSNMINVQLPKYNPLAKVWYRVTCTDTSPPPGALYMIFQDVWVRQKEGFGSVEYKTYTTLQSVTPSGVSGEVILSCVHVPINVLLGQGVGAGNAEVKNRADLWNWMYVGTFILDKGTSGRNGIIECYIDGDIASGETRVMKWEGVAEGTSVETRGDLGMDFVPTVKAVDYMTREERMDEDEFVRSIEGIKSVSTTG